MTFEMNLGSSREKNKSNFFNEFKECNAVVGQYAFSFWEDVMQ
jgi:hypothetical protein